MIRPRRRSYTIESATIDDAVKELASLRSEANCTIIVNIGTGDVDNSTEAESSEN